MKSPDFGHILMYNYANYARMRLFWELGSFTDDSKHFILSLYAISDRSNDSKSRKVVQKSKSLDFGHILTFNYANYARMRLFRDLGSFTKASKHFILSLYGISDRSNDSNSIKVAQKSKSLDFGHILTSNYANYAILRFFWDLGSFANASTHFILA